MGFGRQLTALFYKDVVIQKLKRHYIISLLELVMPVIYVLLVAYIRSQFPNSTGKWHDPQKYDPMGPFTKADISFPQRSKPSTIAYAPDKQYGNDIMNSVFGNPNKYNLKPFANISKLDQYLVNATNVDLAVVFPDQPDLNRLEYLLQFSDLYNMGVGLKYSHSTAPRTPSFYMDPSAYERTLLWPTLYAFFKAHLDHYLIKLPSEDEPLMQPFPSQKYFSSDQLTPDGKDVSFFVLFGLLGGAMASTTYVLFLFGFARNNIAERESRLRVR